MHTRRQRSLISLIKGNLSPLPPLLSPFATMRWLLANSTKILYRDRSTERELYTSSRAWIYWMQASVRGEERERLLIGRTRLRGEMRYLSLQPVFEYNKMDWFRDLRCNFNYNYRRSTGNIEKVELKSGNFGDRSAWFKLFYPIVRGSKRYIIRGGSSRWLIESFVEFETIRQSIIDVLHTCIYHPNIPKQAPLLIPYPRFAVVAANNSKNVPPHRMKKKERERWRRKGKEGEEEEKLLSRQSWANISMRRNRASGQGSHFTSYLCGWIKLYTDLGRLCLSLLSFFSTVSFFIFYFFFGCFSLLFFPALPLLCYAQSFAHRVLTSEHILTLLRKQYSCTGLRWIYCWFRDNLCDRAARPHFNRELFSSGWQALHQSAFI